jgi:hypothetical protein
MMLSNSGRAHVYVCATERRPSPPSSPVPLIAALVTFFLNSGVATFCRYVQIAAVDHEGNDITSSLGKGQFKVTVAHTGMSGKVNMSKLVKRPIVAI